MNIINTKPLIQPIFIKDVNFNQVFRYRGAICIKVTLSGIVNNSQLLTEIIERDDCLVVNLHLHKLFYLNGRTSVELVKSELKISEN